MTWQSLSVEVGARDAEVLSDALLEQGALSAAIEDANAGSEREQPLFGEPGEPAAGVWYSSMVTALFPEDADLPAIVAAIAAAAGWPEMPRFAVERLEEQDWVRLTQAQFGPIEVSPRLWIVPSWHIPPVAEAINLMLDPGLAFGTGSHPTTHLCLQWLDENIRGGERVLDYGCGSGILAIAALKLGAGCAAGVDIDPQAIAASRANAAQNRVAAEFHVAGHAPPFEADVLVANILTNPLKVLAPALAASLASGGRMVLSGILEEQADDVLGVYGEWCEMEVSGRAEGWVRLSGVKR